MTNEHPPTVLTDAERAAVDVLAGLLIRAGHYTLRVNVSRFDAVPSLVLQGHGRLAGGVERADDDNIWTEIASPHWTEIRSEPAPHAAMASRLLAAEAEIATLLSELASRRARDAALLTPPTGPVAGPDEVTGRMAAVEERA